jgi:hypothetical protein
VLFSKHRRWNGKAYEVGFLFDVLGLILESMVFELIVDGRMRNFEDPLNSP